MYINMIILTARVSHKDVWMCADRLDVDRSDKLKVALREYFDEQPEIRDGQVTMLSFAREYGAQDQGSILEKVMYILANISMFIYCSTVYLCLTTQGFRGGGGYF